MVYRNSIFVAVLTAVLGLLITYGAALVTARSNMKHRWKGIINSIALITNTIPGMVIGIAYMLIFSGTPLQNTFWLMILCNVVHFFSTPYLMMKNSLEKLNSSWETTALQYYTKFNEVFVLSLFILGTNLIVKGILGYAIKRENKKKEKE